jgi:hypothetical protein
MILAKLFERFVEETPVTVMARATIEHALPSKELDALFDQHAELQYTRELVFSSVVDMMGLVVSKIHPSVHAAYKAVKDTLPVTLTALYDKLNHLEPAITGALVSHTAQRLESVVRAMHGEVPPLLPGFRVRIIDGSHLAATQRRLEVLRGSIAGPLPGHSLVVLDPELMLATHMIPCEDGHAQERSLSAQIVSLAKANDVWIADRNFCTTTLLTGIAKQLAFFVIRHHANLPFVTVGTLRRCGRTDTGNVFEQSVTIRDSDGQMMKLRRVVIRLDKPTRDGDSEMSILTNLPKKAASGVAVAELYRNRWKVETMFQSLTQMLNGEIDTLAYPRAALLGFATALLSFNVLSTVQAALRAAFGTEKVQNEVSAYYIANEIRVNTGGMKIAIEPEVWREFETMKPAVLANNLVRWASHADLTKYERSRRGPKKPVPKRTRFPKKTHVSTARLLAESRRKSP